MDCLNKLILQFQQAQEVGLVSDIVHQTSTLHPTHPIKTTINFYPNIDPAVVRVLCAHLKDDYVDHDHIRNVTCVFVDGGVLQITFYSKWQNES